MMLCNEIKLDLHNHAFNNLHIIIDGSKYCIILHILKAAIS